MEPTAAGLKKVLEEIAAGEIKPVYLVSGDEEFLIREAINGIIDSLLPGKTRELNLQVFETEEDWQQIIQSLNTFGWFGARRVIVVKDSRIFVAKFNVENLAEKSLSQFEEGNREEGIRLYRMALGYKGFEKIEDIPEGDLSGLPGFNDNAKTKTLLKEILHECRKEGMHPIPYADNAEELSTALKDGIPENNVLILATKDVDRRRSLYKTIAAVGAVIDLSMSIKPWDMVAVEREERNLLHEQADKLLEKSGKSLEPDAFDLLFAKTGFQIGIFMNELEKLIPFTDQKKITAADVVAIVGRTKEDSISDLQEALSRKDFGKVVFYLRELLAQGEFYLVLLQSIVAQVRRLMLAKDLMDGELKEKWNRQMNEEAFLKRIYFPLILPKKREREAAEKEGRRRKGAPNIYKMPSNVLFRLFRAAQNFTREELENALRTLADADLELKSARIPPIFILEEALMSLCMPQRGGMGKENSETLSPG